MTGNLICVSSPLFFSISWSSGALRNITTRWQPFKAWRVPALISVEITVSANEICGLFWDSAENDATWKWTADLKVKQTQHTLKRALDGDAPGLRQAWEDEEKSRGDTHRSQPPAPWCPRPSRCLCSPPRCPFWTPAATAASSPPCGRSAHPRLRRRGKKKCEDTFVLQCQPANSECTSSIFLAVVPQCLAQHSIDIAMLCTVYKL